MEVARMNREPLRKYLSETEPVMEIGPLNKPFLSRDMYNVYYADIHNKEDIFKKYLNSGEGYNLFNLNTSEELYSSIMPIDFVVKDSYKGAVGDLRFSGIFSSHVIEHTTDIIQHLNELYDCLIDGGYLVMAIPDKRYTFDRFREVTPFRDAFAFHISGSRDTLARLAFDSFFSYHPCNSSSEFHNNSVSFFSTAIDPILYDNAYKTYCMVKGGYMTTSHLWVFTYQSFIAFLRDGVRSGFFSYSLEYSAEPSGNGNEFHVVLKKNKLIQQDENIKLKEIIKLQRIIDEIDGISYYSDLMDFCAKSDSLFIYGTGGIARGAYSFMTAEGFDVRGFIVSDNQQKPSTFYNRPVQYLSDFSGEGQYGVLVALGRKAEIVPMLNERNIRYFELT
jgi:SAM-dependent methyltransferase